MSRPRIIIADDHTLVAGACRQLLEPEFEVVATVGDGRELLRVAETLRPDVIVIDIGMPLLNGLDASEQLKKAMPKVKIVILTMNTDADVAAEAFRRGASAYLPKTCAADELKSAVRQVLKGMTYLSRVMEAVKDQVGFLIRQDGVLVEQEHRLTSRQREVLQLLAEGKVMKEVAAILNMAPRTVAFHKYRIMETLGVRNSAQLVQHAIRYHLIAA